MAADGILLLSEPDDPGYVARLRIFNPDGSEAELSGNGAREAVMYLRRHDWTDADSFAMQTAAGDIRPRITSATECTVDMGRATATSPSYPSGAYDGRGELTAAGRNWRFQFVQVGNPQTAIRVKDEHELEHARPAGRSVPRSSTTKTFPNRTNVSWFAELDSTPPTPGWAGAESGRGSSSAVWGRHRPAAPAPPGLRSRTSSTADALR